MSDLKPCPFCGATPWLSYSADFTFIKCIEADCLVNPSAEGNRNEAEAISVWNTRAPVVVTDEIVERAYTAYVEALIENSGWNNRAAMRAALEAALNGETK